VDGIHVASCGGTRLPGQTAYTLLGGDPLARLRHGLPLRVEPEARAA
jgi:hypothetical protein